MNQTRTWIAILLLFCLAAVEAENEQTTTSSKLTTQTATTSDGRKVILKSDGTWEYFKETPPAITIPKEKPPSVAPSETPSSVTVPKAMSPSAAVSNEKGTLSFDAQVVSKPIAEGTFYLLNDDLNRILQTSGLKPEKRLSLLNTFSMANYGSTLGIQRSAKAFAKAMESVKPHIVATTTSDSNGKGQFSSLVPGTYYLVNVSVVYLNTDSLTDRRAILWNLQVHIQPGQNFTSLNEKNTVL